MFVHKRFNQKKLSEGNSKMFKRITENPITSLLGITAGATSAMAASQIDTGSDILEIAKYIVSVIFTLWGLFSRRG